MIALAFRKPWLAHRGLKEIVRGASLLGRHVGERQPVPRPRDEVPVEALLILEREERLLPSRLVEKGDEGLRGGGRVRLPARFSSGGKCEHRHGDEQAGRPCDPSRRPIPDLHLSSSAHHGRAPSRIGVGGFKLVHPEPGFSTIPYSGKRDEIAR